MTSIKEAMESAGYIEITEKEAHNLIDLKYIVITYEDNTKHNFKKKPEPKFPKVFENSEYKIIAIQNGITIEHNYSSRTFDFFKDESLPLLIEAIKYWEANEDD